MNCAVHTDTPAAAFCRTCGKALCENCKRDVMGAIYCEPCIAARLQGAPVAGQPAAVPLAPQPGAPSPGLALLLGFIPGVGAMYNGQFMKAFVHVVIFAVLVAASSTIDAFGFLVAFWIFYMAFEAYKTAQARQLGHPLPDPLGLDRLFGLQDTQPSPAATPVTGTAGPATAAPFPAEQAPPAQPRDNTPTAAILLIALGVFFLLGNFGMHVHRLWPLFVIGVGLWIAYKRAVLRT